MTEAGGPPPEKGLVLIGKAQDFPEGQAVPVAIGSRRLVVYRVGGALHALKDICPHEGDFLHRRPPSGGAAVCAGHGYRFDLLSGRCVHGDPRLRVAVYPVEVRGDAVLVRVG